MKKKIPSLVLALVMCFGLTVPAFAAGKTIYVQYAEQTDSSGMIIPGARTAPAGEEENASFRLDADELEETGVFYEKEETSDGVLVSGPYPVYSSVSAVTITLVEGYTKEEALQRSEESYTDGVNTLSVAQVSYDTTNNSIALVEEHIAYFDGMVYFIGKDPCTIQDYYIKDEETNGEYYWASPSIEIGASVTLSQPGTYLIREQWADTYGAQEALVIISEKETDTSTNPDPVVPVEPVVKTAEPTNDQLYIDGALAVPTAYKIGGSNYFKIRDVAALLNGTDAQFSVDYDNDTQIVYLVTGQSYEKKSSDLAGVSAGSKEAISSNDVTYVNGEKVELTVYKIGGSNYYKLRDLGKALGFNVGYTDGYGAFIETDKPYEA